MKNILTGEDLAIKLEPVNAKEHSRTFSLGPHFYLKYEVYGIKIGKKGLLEFFRNEPHAPYFVTQNTLCYFLLQIVCIRVPGGPKNRKF